MLSVEMTDDEKAILAEALDRSLRDLSYEIADTDSYDYRENLKKRRDVIQRVRNALSDGASP